MGATNPAAHGDARGRTGQANARHAPTATPRHDRVTRSTVRGRRRASRRDTARAKRRRRERGGHDRPRAGRRRDALGADDEGVGGGVSPEPDRPPSRARRRREQEPRRRWACGAPFLLSDAGRRARRAVAADRGAGAGRVGRPPASLGTAATWVKTPELRSRGHRAGTAGRRMLGRRRAPCGMLVRRMRRRWPGDDRVPDRTFARTRTDVR